MDDANQYPEFSSMGTLEVDTNGNLFIGGGGGGSSQFWCIRSTNAQNGSVTPTFDQIHRSAWAAV
jgi:hypothetical protein